jgi:uncharacterized protein with HEPN domain/predicted nucleotidyltransferase
MKNRPVVREKERNPERAQARRVRRVPSLAELVRALRARQPALRKQYGVRSLGVFGSFVRGTQKLRSDLDVLVEFDERERSILDDVALKDELGKALGIKVDLVENKNLRPFIGRRILSEVVWLWRDGKALRVRVPRRKRGGYRMPSKREYLDYLNDMLQAMDHAERFVTGVTFEEFIENEEKVLATTKAVENIGEAVKHIPAEVRARYPEIDWKGMAGTRDHLAHGYFAISFPRLWENATILIPTAKPLVRAALESELQRRAQEEGKRNDSG